MNSKRKREDTYEVGKADTVIAVLQMRKAEITFPLINSARTSKKGEDMSGDTVNFSMEYK